MAPLPKLIKYNKNVVLVIFTLLSCAQMGESIPSRSSSALSCEAVENIFQYRGIMANEIPERPLLGTSLKICEVSVTGTCCTDDMETKLTNYAKSQIERNIRDLIQKLSAVLKTRAQKFNEHFKELLTQSKREFHEMFKRTYGAIYEQNSHLFQVLFNELENYFARGNIDLVEAMDSFFNTLYQKMFTVINMQYHFDDKYLGCVSEHMKELKPFGDVPDKLSVQIKRSFVATRTYAQALSTAAEVTKNVQNIRLSTECTNALTRMQVCGACKGYSEKPCYSYCINLMKGCLNYFSDMNAEWDNFVSSMDKIADRLLGPFNIVNVVEPINIKISEAIMNFQDSGTDITQQIFQGCGRPKLGQQHSRLQRDTSNLVSLDMESSMFFEDSSDDIFIARDKREANPSKKHDMQYDNLNFDDMENNGSKNRRRNKNKKPTKNNFEEETRDTYMDKLIKDIRQKVKDSKKFWANLPYQTCNNQDIAAHSSIDAQCWNGQIIDLYTVDQSKNIDFGSSSTLRNSNLINQQLYKLRKVNSQLRNAFNGMDVEWGDQEDPYYGSGSGSGFDDEDDEGEIGSGQELETITPRLPDLPTITTTGEMTRGIDFTETPKIDTTSTQFTIVSTSSGRETSAGGGASSTRLPQMSKLKAASVYLVPILITWFGGLFSELL